MTKTNDSGKDRSSFPLLTQVKYRRQSCCRIFTVFVVVAVRILYLLTLFYMHIFHLHREGQLSVIESIFKYNRNVLTVVQASSNVIQWI